VSDNGYGDFEFERRFVARDVPRELLDENPPTLIVQSYLLADEGYALRLRVQSGTARAGLGPGSDPLDVLAAHADDFDFCALTAKGPMIGGTRYEAERELDVSMGVEMVRRGGLRIVKNRHSAWLGADGWVIDVFGGPNHPLVIAECERSGPVTDLQIPSFCVTEVTDDHRFANDALVHAPYATWSDAFDRELAERGPRFLQGFGRNTALPDGR
jgi:CYTH domain-containing protein